MSFAVRPARPADNEALLRLSLACPMEGDIALAIDRAPDFFALNRLEGTTWHVGVVDGADGCPVGCVAVAERDVYVNGEPRPAMYISDLRVHPAHRGRGAVDALLVWAHDVCVAAHGPDVLAFMTVLAGNHAMRRLMNGPRGLPVIEHVATLRTHTIPMVWRRRTPLSVATARPGDVPEMAELWGRRAATRQFATVYDAASLGAWIEDAPGLALSDYCVARRPHGAMAGFLGVWDQSGFKRLRVTGYSPKLAAARAAFNAVAPLTGATKLPPPGGALGNLTAVHVCAPPDEPAVLRALLVHAYNENRSKGYSFLNIGLDVEDALAAGLKGLLGQATDVWICVARFGTARPPLDGRPSYVELALA